jgi:hypothetical protein
MPCDHKKKEGVRLCGTCGADLTLTQEEIDERDKLYPLFIENMITHNNKEHDNALNRRLLDVFVSQNALTIAMKMTKLTLELTQKDLKFEPKEDLKKKVEKLEAELGEIKKML